LPGLATRVYGRRVKAAAAREQTATRAAPTQAHPVRARNGIASVLALQRSIGNAATRRLLARSPRKPYQHQWENPALVETIYPARETMLKKFVSMYREIELADVTDSAERQKVIEATRAGMQKEIERLKALTEPTAKDTARIKALEAGLAKGAQSAGKAWDDAVAWEREHRTDAMAGDALMAEVKRLFGTKGVPDWLEPMVLDYAGMRYKSAHGSYYNPVRLLYFVERHKGTWAAAATKETTDANEAYEKKKAEWDAADKKTRGKVPAKPKAIKTSAAERAAKDISPDDAIKRLEAMHDAGEIPEWAWHKIVRLTELRTYYADKGWEDTAAEKPDGSPNDALWTKAFAGWTGDEPIGNLGYGITGWRSEIHRRNALVTTRMVCNELSEATQKQRGIDLRGGISKNARQYIGAATSNGGKPPVAGAYFRQPASLDDFKPGAALFWINRSEWMTEEPDDSNKVYGIPGVDKYPMPPPPEYVKEWKAWRDGAAGKAWKKADDSYKKDLKAYEEKVKKAKAAAAKAKTTYDPASAGAAPVEPTDTQPEYKERKDKLLPADGEVSNGWTYTVKVGQPITRSKDGVTHWLRWQHQATVLKAMSASRIFTFETTDALAGAAHLGVSGFGERSLAELARPGVFVAYMPGDVDPVEATASEDAPVLPIPDDIVDLFKVMLYDF
jgi:hypothetical protein